jgi:hypothetical protein
MFWLYRPKILIGLVLLCGISIARADSVSYNLQTYTFPDLLNSSFTDTLSGTLTLTNSAGSVFTTYNAGDPSLANVTMSATFTMQSSSNTIAPVTISVSPTSIGADVPPVLNWLQIGSLTATASGLSLSNPGVFNINYEPGVQTFPPYISGHWDTAAGDDGGAMSFFASPGNTGGAATMQIFPQNLDSQPAPEFGPGSWLIAVAVPEPSSLLLLSFGVAGLLIRRRLRK